MADIVDPQIIRFCNEQLRPICEQLRALDARLQAAQTTWTAVRQAASLPNDASPILDGREAEGVSRLLASDMYTVMSTIVGAIETVFGTGAYRTYISKPCVRALEVS